MADLFDYRKRAYDPNYGKVNLSYKSVPPTEDLLGNSSCPPGYTYDPTSNSCVASDNGDNEQVVSNVPVDKYGTPISGTNTGNKIGVDGTYGDVYNYQVDGYGGNQITDENFSNKVGSNTNFTGVNDLGLKQGTLSGNAATQKSGLETLADIVAPGTLARAVKSAITGKPDFSHNISPEQYGVVATGANPATNTIPTGLLKDSKGVETFYSPHNTMDKQAQGEIVAVNADGTASYNGKAYASYEDAAAAKQADNAAGASKSTEQVVDEIKSAINAAIAVGAKTIGQITNYVQSKVPNATSEDVVAVADNIVSAPVSTVGPNAAQGVKAPLTAAQVEAQYGFVNPSQATIDAINGVGYSASGAAPAGSQFSSTGTFATKHSTPAPAPTPPAPVYSPPEQQQDSGGESPGDGNTSAPGSSGNPSAGAGDYSDFSDRRLKTDIEKIGKTNKGADLYRYKMDGKVMIGPIAQELKKTQPKAVKKDEDTGFFKVDYQQLNSGGRANKISKIYKEGYKAPGQAYAIAKSMGYNNGGNIPTYNDGGNLLNHPYDREGEQFDTVPTLLTPGEFVVDADSTHKFGSLLEDINGWEPGGKEPTMEEPMMEEPMMEEQTDMISDAAEETTVKRKFKDGTEIIIKSPQGTTTELKGLLKDVTKVAKTKHDKKPLNFNKGGLLSDAARAALTSVRDNVGRQLNPSQANRGFQAQREGIANQARQKATNAGLNSGINALGRSLDNATSRAASAGLQTNQFGGGNASFSSKRLPETNFSQVGQAVGQGLQEQSNIGKQAQQDINAVTDNQLRQSETLRKEGRSDQETQRKLAENDNLLQQGLISPEEHKQRRAALLGGGKTKKEVDALNAIGETLVETMKIIPTSAKALALRQKAVSFANKAYGAASLIPAVNADAISKTRDESIKSYMRKKIGNGITQDEYNAYSELEQRILRLAQRILNTQTGTKTDFDAQNAAAQIANLDGNASSIFNNFKVALQDVNRSLKTLNQPTITIPDIKIPDVTIEDDQDDNDGKNGTINLSYDNKEYAFNKIDKEQVPRDVLALKAKKNTLIQGDDKYLYIKFDKSNKDLIRTAWFKSQESF